MSADVGSSYINVVCEQWQLDGLMGVLNPELLYVFTHFERVFLYVVQILVFNEESSQQSEMSFSLKEVRIPQIQEFRKFSAFFTSGKPSRHCLQTYISSILFISLQYFLQIQSSGTKGNSMFEKHICI